MSTASETVGAVGEAERAARRRLRKAQVRADAYVAEAQEQAKATLEEARKEASRAAAESQARAVERARREAAEAKRRLVRELEDERDRAEAARSALVARMAALVMGQPQEEPCSSP